jgi:hypothetical protein
MVDATARVDAVVSSPPFSRMSWGSIIAGTLCAFALQLFFNMVGLGIGLSAADLSSGEAAKSIGIGAGIWYGVSSIISLVIGGWIAGRLAGVPLRTAAALHGASVWALATLLTVWLATSTVATAVSGAFGALGQIGQVTASAVGSGAQALGQGGASLVAGAGGSGADQRQSVMRSIRTEAGRLFGDVVSPQQQEAAETALTDTARNIATNPGNASQELNTLIDRLFSADGVFTDEDRQEVLTILEQRLGLSREEAERTVQNWQDRYQSAVAEVRQGLERAKEEAAEAARATADAVGAAAGWTSLALFLGLVAAVVGGLLGKPQPWIVETLEEEGHQRLA